MLRRHNPAAPTQTGLVELAPSAYAPNRAERRRAGERVVRPRQPAPPCAAGCGRVARRMIRERHVTTERDLDGRELGSTTRVYMVPYCASCTPKSEA